MSMERGCVKRRKGADRTREESGRVKADDALHPREIPRPLAGRPFRWVTGARRIR